MDNPLTVSVTHVVACDYGSAKYNVSHCEARLR